MCSSWSNVSAPRGSPGAPQAATGTGAFTSRRPSRTRIPISACVMLFAIDQDWKRLSGLKPGA